jgi:hypothetical protein
VRKRGREEERKRGREEERKRGREEERKRGREEERRRDSEEGEEDKLFLAVVAAMRPETPLRTSPTT